MAIPKFSANVSCVSAQCSIVKHGFIRFADAIDSVKEVELQLAPLFILCSTTE